MQRSITKRQVTDLQKKSDNVKLVDIRPAVEFEKMHVPGSMNIPADALEENTSQFSSDDIIVCVCTKGLERSQNAANAFTRLGFDNVYYLEHGVTGWLTEPDPDLT